MSRNTFILDPYVYLEVKNHANKNNCNDSPDSHCNRGGDRNRNRSGPQSAQAFVVDLTPMTVDMADRLMT